MTSPVDTPTAPYVFDFEAARAKDQELYEAWSKAPNKKTMGELVHHLGPLIYKEVSRASGSLPVSALSAEAKIWTAKAIQTFDPTKGVALSTHVTNYLPKVRRMNYKYQNAVRLPENMQLQFHEYNKHLAQLSDELNRDPTEEEMAHRLGWSKGQVVKFKGSLYADLMEGSSEKASEHSRFSDESILMNHLYSRLTSDELFLLKDGSAMTANQLCTHFNVNLNRLNYMKKKLTAKIHQLKAELEI